MADVLIVTNIPAPYRPSIYEEINEVHDVTVFYTGGSQADRNWDVQCDKWTFDQKFLNIIQFPPISINHDIVEELLKDDFDTVIVGDNPSSILTTIAIALYCSITRTNFLIWTGGIDTPWKQRGFKGILRRGFDAVRKQIYRRADGGIAYSELSVDFLTERSFDEEDIVTGTQFYDAEQLPEKVEAPSNDGESVLYVGQLIPRKGISKLLELVDGWPRNRKLLIAGDGDSPVKEAVLEKAESSSSVEYLGYISDEEKARVMTRADVLVLPTNHDPWGFVTNEALYYGTPAVVTDVAGSSELVSETGAGTVVEPVAAEIDRGIERVLSDISHYEERAEAASDYATEPKHGARAFLEAIENASEG